MAPGRRGLACVSVDPVVAGCAACDDDARGGVRKRSVHCAVVGWNLSADHCRWSTGSPAKSSYHSPGPLNRRHPLEETDRKEQCKNSIKSIKVHKMDCKTCFCKVDVRSRFKTAEEK